MPVGTTMYVCIETTNWKTTSLAPQCHFGMYIVGSRFFYFFFSAFPGVPTAADAGATYLTYLAGR